MALKWIFVLVLVIKVVCGQRKPPQKFDAGRWFDRALVNYNKDTPPSHITGVPTEVRTGMYIISIQNIDHGGSMSMTSNLYLRQQWRDPRLAFNASFDKIVLPDSAWKKIWIPDLFFRNQIESTLQSNARENALLTVNQTGFLWFVLHMNLVTSCPMKLQKYPFDTQACPMMIESFRHNMDTLYLSWLNNPAQIDALAQIPGYTLSDTILYDCSQNYTVGSFPCLEVRFLLQRDIGYYILQMFLPTILTVMISWLSFWIDGERYSDRLHLLLILMLILFIQYAIINSKVVQVAYTKASDVWMIICMLFVFLAMLQATIVKALGYNTMKMKEGGEESFDYATLLGKVYTPREVRRVIDLACRIIFPVGFLLVVIIYFSLYKH